MSNQSLVATHRRGHACLDRRHRGQSTLVRHTLLAPPSHLIAPAHNPSVLEGQRRKAWLTKYGQSEAARRRFGLSPVGATD